MPVYEYECEDCGKVSSKLRPMARREVAGKCEACGGKATYRPSVPGRFQRGSGWRARMDGASMPGEI